MADHFHIKRYEKELERKKRPWGGGPGDRTDRAEFTESQTQNIDSIVSEHKKIKLKFGRYFDPNLIFRIKVNGRPDESQFADFLRKCHLNYISPSPISQTSEGELSYRVSHAEKDNLDDIKERLKQYNLQGKYKNFFEIVTSIEEIPPEDKIGSGLVKKPLIDDIAEFVDIELWRMEDSLLNRAIDGLKNFILENGGIASDDIITNSFCLLRAKITNKIMGDIIRLSEVSCVDRPPHIKYELSVPFDEIETGNPPSDDAPTIIVLDSGVLSGHPFLENGIGDEIEGAYLIEPSIFPNNYVDDVGHGTMVAGVALYGDIKKCNEEGRFNPEFFILSGKVLYKKIDEVTGLIYPDFDERVSVETLIKTTIDYFLNHYPNSRIVNISFVTDKEAINLRWQHRISSLIDEIAEEKDLIFVICTGNVDGRDIQPHIYPKYLLEKNRRVKIVEPASSAYSLTVGSIAQEYLSPQADASLFPEPQWPSIFTRVGPGLNDMIKPEFVEYGGNESYNDELTSLHNGVVVLNPEWRKESKLLTTGCGTSFSTPKITNYIARLCKKFPHYDSNTIKALLLSSAQYPDNRPEPLDIDLKNASSAERTNLLNVYGYGKPNIDYAESSENNHVCFIAFDKIPIDAVHFYELYLPEEFITTHGKRDVDVTLVYNPPVWRNRADYFGVKLSFKLFRNTSIDELVNHSSQLVHEADNSDEDDEYNFPQIYLQPTNKIRSKGLHQKGSISYVRPPNGIEIDKPLILGIICKGNWIKKTEDPDFKQNYSIVISLKHHAEINLYSKVLQTLRTRVQRLQV